MDEVVDDLNRIAERCERAAQVFDDEPLASIRAKLLDACESVGRTWSGSWIGYHAAVYTEGLRPREPGEHFDSDWGWSDAWSNETTGEWREYAQEAVRREILRRAGDPDPDALAEAARDAAGTFDECKRDLLPTFDAAIVDDKDAALAQLRDKLAKLRDHISRSDLVNARAPKQVMTRDMRALQGRIQVPHHIAFEIWIAEVVSYGRQAKALAAIARHAAKYLQKRRRLKDNIPGAGGPIFIGHGRSAVWKDLKDFLVDRLGLVYEEFNRQPVAGRSTKERLLEMLQTCCFAFLIMTAEDEHDDGKKHARQNVVHEAGLFQGRYGFERAIVLLEQDCEEFSNIHGIGQIRFPKNNIAAISEDIRRVLEREGML